MGLLGSARVNIQLYISNSEKLKKTVTDKNDFQELKEKGLTYIYSEEFVDHLDIILNESTGVEDFEIRFLEHKKALEDEMLSDYSKTSYIRSFI